MAVYYGDFGNRESVESNFEVKLDEGAEVLFACYTYENYEGSALVIFRQGGKLYEVNGGHCSCNGLEGQWAPEETTVAALKSRDLSYYFNESATRDLRAFLDSLEVAP